MAKIRPIVLSGGSGVRLWPVSRPDLPKQFRRLGGARTLFQETVLRFRGPDAFAPPVVVCNAEHRHAAAAQLREAGVAPSGFVLEPEGRNTGPAVALAALRAAEEDPDALLLATPSDHAIRRPEALRQAVAAGAAAARAGRIVVFGVPPDRPETGYGYIEAGAEIAGAPGCRAVARFVEKPDAGTARAFLAAGGHFWNAGLFLFRAGALAGELRRLAPEIEAACRAALAGARRDGATLRPDPAAFRRAPAVALDRAVMEKTGRAAVVPADPGWSDVGSWAALWEASERDADGNRLDGDAAAFDTRNALVRSESRLVVAVGIEGVAVVETPDAVLAVALDRAQDARAAVEALRAAERPEAAAHSRARRPWGSFERLDAGPGYQVKRLVVDPGAALSLQRHARRAEHWTVAAGTARVVLGPDLDRLETVELGRGASIDIPLGWVHRLENPGGAPLVVVEVQTGGYLGEDDIERFEDRYGRAPARPPGDVL